MIETVVTHSNMDRAKWAKSLDAFNEWVAGTFLEPIENRTIRQIALNLMEGATRLTRAGQMRACGIGVPPSAFSYTPRKFL